MWPPKTTICLCCFSKAEFLKMFNQPGMDDLTAVYRCTNTDICGMEFYATPKKTPKQEIKDVQIG